MRRIILNNASRNLCQPLLIGMSDYNFGSINTIVELPKVMCFDFGNISIGGSDSYKIMIRKGADVSDQDMVIAQVVSSYTGSSKYNKYFYGFDGSVRYHKTGVSSDIINFNHNIKMYVESMPECNYHVYLYVDQVKRQEGDIKQNSIQTEPYILSPFSRIYITGTVVNKPGLEVYMVDNIGD